MNTTDTRVSHQDDAADQDRKDGGWNVEPVPAKEQPLRLAGSHHEIFYDAREVYGGY